MIGRTVSHYRITHKIGEGGMGVVYRAEDLTLGRTVALKFLSKDLMGDAAQRERFLREARVVANIEHQNICTIHEVGQTDDGQIFICMACYEGDTLKDVIRRGAVSAGEAVKLAIQIARGLAAAHAAGVTHRDVKPGNIMISQGGHVRLVDFGLAKRSGQSSLTRDGNVVGTVAYMSPEQTRGEQVDERTDIWALGVILYEIASGRRPFIGGTEPEVVRAIQRDRPQSLSEIVPRVPPELSEIVMKALEKKAGRRYPSMSEMLDDMQELARRLQLSDDTRTRVWRYARTRERNLRLIAYASAILVVTVAAMWAASRLRAQKPLPEGIPMQVTRGPGWEGEPMISPDGTRIVYVSNTTGNSDVYVKDVLSDSVLQLTDEEAMDFAPTWFPDGSEVAFVSDRSGKRSVWKVGQFGGAATMLLDNAEYPAISPDGTRIAFSRADDAAELRIWVTSLDDTSHATKLTGSEHGLWDHVNAAWSPDGRTLSYSSLSNLWVVPATGGPPHRLTSGNAGVGESAWSSDGEYIYFDSWRDRTLALWRIWKNGGSPRRLTQGTGYESEPSVSSDGSRFAYSTGNPGSGAVIVDLETGQRTSLGVMRHVLLASLSPTGDRIVFASERWDRRAELAEQSLVDGVPSGPPRRLTDQEGDAAHPSYSPDGRWIAYYLIEGEEERDIWIVPSGGGSPRQFTNDPGREVHPAWSPDGGRIAFMSQRAGTRDVWVAPVEDGMPAGEPVRLTDGGVAALFPAWSPDGTEIAFVGLKDGDVEIWVVPSDGEAPARPLTDGVDATTIRWDAETGVILAAATCGEKHRSLWKVSPLTGDVAPFEPEIVFGSERACGMFDVSSGGRLMVFSLDDPVGNVWVSEGPPGTY